MVGAHAGLRWEENRLQLAQESPVRAGLLVSIIGGMTMSRARCYGHHARGPRLGVTTPHCVFPTCAGCQVNETTIHRF